MHIIFYANQKLFIDLMLLFKIHNQTLYKLKFLKPKNIILQLFKGSLYYYILNYFKLISWVSNFCHCLNYRRITIVTYQIGYVVDRYPRRQFQTLISQIMQMNSIFKEFENLSVEKKTLSTALAQWLEQSTGNRKT